MNLNKAIQIATIAHEGQLDKAGEPYILHPLRLMMKFTKNNYQIIAVLHDVVEDSRFCLTYLEKEGFDSDILNAIDLLTRRKVETYNEFIGRIDNGSAYAVRIKIEDLKDNLNILRLKTVDDSDLKRMKKYLIALRKLESRDWFYS